MVSEWDASLAGRHPRGKFRREKKQLGVGWVQQGRVPALRSRYIAVFLQGSLRVSAPTSTPLLAGFCWMWPLSDPAGAKGKAKLLAAASTP